MIKKPTDIDIAKKLIQLHSSATSRNLEFNLTLQTVRRLLNRKRCFFTNKEFEEDGKFKRSIDRIDSFSGYVEGNVVACTVDINSKKGQLSIEEILQMAEKITKHNDTFFS